MAPKKGWKCLYCGHGMSYRPTGVDVRICSRCHCDDGGDFFFEVCKASGNLIGHERCNGALGWQHRLCGWGDGIWTFGVCDDGGGDAPEPFQRRQLFRPKESE